MYVCMMYVDTYCVLNSSTHSFLAMLITRRKKIKKNCLHHERANPRVHVCMHVCTYVCVYVCIRMYVCICIRFSVSYPGIIIPLWSCPPVISDPYHPPMRYIGRLDPQFASRNCFIEYEQHLRCSTCRIRCQNRPNVEAKETY